MSWMKSLYWINCAIMAYCRLLQFVRMDFPIVRQSAISSLSRFNMFFYYCYTVYLCGHENRGWLIGEVWKYNFDVICSPSLIRARRGALCPLGLISCWSYGQLYVAYLMRLMKDDINNKRHWHVFEWLRLWNRTCYFHIMLETIAFTTQ